MRAVRNTADGVEVFDAPEPDGADEVLAIRSASICGSDFGYMQLGVPFVLGHELAGILPDGSPAAVEAIFPCGECDQCRAGTYNRCRHASDRVPGFSIDGGMADYFALPAGRAVPLPTGLDMRDASLVEPAAVAWHGVRKGGASGETRVGVVGGGSIGLMAVAAARAMGAPDVGLVARHARQIEAGERLGASEAGAEYDVVIEAAGTESSLAQAVELAAPGGTVIVLGVFGELLPVPFIPAFMKEVNVLGSMAYCRYGARRDVDDAAAMLASDPEIIRTLVTHRFPLDDAAEAFRVAADRRGGAIKVIVEP